MHHKMITLWRILRSDERPFRRLLGILIMKLPFDIGKIISFKIQTHDFYIRLHQSARSVGLLHNPNERKSDYEFLTKFLKEGDIYCDVGANIGTTLIPAAKTIGRSGRAIAFEPHPRIFAYLRDNVRLNNLTNIELHNCAIGNRRGYIWFSDNKIDELNRIQEMQVGLKVPLMLLDDIGMQLPKISLLKIDVEGYEQFVIEGGIDTLKKTDCVYIEVSENQFGNFGYSVQDLLKMLQALDFILIVRRSEGKLQRVFTDYSPQSYVENLIATKSVEDLMIRTQWDISNVENQPSNHT